MTPRPTVLITGAAKRLGAATAQNFFARGCNLALHYNHSAEHAKQLQHHFNQQRAHSCLLLQADLEDQLQLTQLLNKTLDKFGRLDHLINNASIFYPHSLMQTASKTHLELTRFIDINLHAPLTLTKLAAQALSQNQGSVVNLIDIYAQAGLAEHCCYVASKSALQHATYQLALELAPHVRVNGVSPGAILWPDEATQSAEALRKQQSILDNTALKVLGKPEHIAATITYLALDAHYTTGSVIRVDGGRRDYL